MPLNSSNSSQDTQTSFYEWQYKKHRNPGFEMLHSISGVTMKGKEDRVNYNGMALN